ncbi:MAG: ATP-binding cassette domain-containing protein [Bacteroidota bacterium]|nr:ATP-binding cassette domain-containing protein [Bacteroidota bacterium]
MTILKISGLDKSYGSVHAVKNLHLEVKKGQVFGILGPNGSGKTTTLAMLLGVVRMNKGTYSWFSQPPGPANQQKIGSMLESPNFYPYLNLIENLKITCRIKRFPEAEVFRVLKVVGLLERQKSKFQTLSLGMKQRLALASVLLGDPEVLVLDEPANGLDPEGIAQVREIIRKEAKKGKTIIMASHILVEVEKVCSHVAILRKGELLASGEVGSLLRNDVKMVLASDAMDELQQFLHSFEGVTSMVVESDHIQVILKEGFAPGDLNKAVVKNGIILNKMEEHKQSLEEQFLELVKKDEMKGGLG